MTFVDGLVAAPFSTQPWWPPGVTVAPERDRGLVPRLLVSAVLAVGVVIWSAGPAAAHAVLLRTEPSPQATVKTGPSAVLLVFSEAVEVSLGGVRVYNVDGHRVDKGKIRTANRRRE